MSCGGRSEARLWLCNNLSSLKSITPHHYRGLFVKILRSKPLKRSLATQVLQMIFEKHPQKVGSILAKKSHLLEDFFKIISRGRQLLRLVHEEEEQEKRATIKDLVMQICTFSSHLSSLAPTIKECSTAPVKWLGILSWAIHYRLSEAFQTPESWESLFTDNGISFRKSNKYELLHHDGFSEEWESDTDERISIRVGQRKREKHRKKRRKNLDDDNYDIALLDPDTSKNRLGLQSRAGSWLLSTDGYTTEWSSADLPEHLSKHCFSTWMKWFLARWRVKA